MDKGSIQVLGAVGIIFAIGAFLGVFGIEAYRLWHQSQCVTNSLFIDACRQTYTTTIITKAFFGLFCGVGAVVLAGVLLTIVTVTGVQRHNP